MARKRRLIAADCETNPFEYNVKITPFIWGAFDGDQYEEFFSTDDFVKWAKDQDAIIYAHNGGKFDWHFLLPYLDPFEKIMLIGGRIAKVRLGKAELRDSFSILPVSLADMEKEKFDYDKMRPENRAAHMGEIREYLQSDCVNLFNWVTDFVSKYGRNLTLASAALAEWRRISGLESPQTNKAFYERFEPYYYGGRVECFEKGLIKRDFKVVDINSAYPEAMMGTHPWGNTFSVTEDLEGADFVTVKATSVGAFPIRTKNGLVFPDDGEIRTFNITGHELEAALEICTAFEIVEIERAIRFDQRINFKAYVDYYYEQKKNSKKGTPEYLFAKLMLNALYGKFGAAAHKYKERMILPHDHVAAAEVQDGYQWAGQVGDWALVERQLPDHMQRHYNVATAASITGQVRAKMFRALRSVEKPIYCDTDSIAASDLGNLELDADRLGAWDLEAECYEGAVVAKKIYAFKHLPDKDGNEWKTASKGVRLTPEQIYEAANGNEIEYKKESPSFNIKRPVDTENPEMIEKMYIKRKIKMA